MADDLKTVKLVSGVLHESPLRGGTLVLRGVLDSASLKQLRFDDYQREALPLSSLTKLTAAVKEGATLPDIEIGMRGQKYTNKGEDWLLTDPCYVVDGQQRITACINAMSMYPGTQVFLGATIHFDTDKEWERQRFRILNNARVKVSPNVLLRNMRGDHPSIAKIYEMTNASDSFFCIGGRVSWDQNMKRDKLFTALNTLRVIGRLHQHISPGMRHSVDYIGGQLDRLMEKTTPNQLRDNVKVFFDTIDEVWGIRMVQYRQLANHLNAGFLTMFARTLSNHHDFWKGDGDKKLFIATDLKAKMATFAIHDPGIAPLTSSAGAAHHILYDLFVKHINSGKRIKKLQPREDVIEDVVELTKGEVA